MSDKETAIKGMRARMKQAGLSFVDNVDIRTFAKMCVLGDGDIGKAIDYKLDASCMQAVIEGDTDGFLPGPFISCKSSLDSDGRTIFEIHMALFYPDVSVRKAAVGLCNQFANNRPRIMTSKTRGILEKSAADLVGDDEPKWLSAACDVFDALSDDFLFATAGLRQILTTDSIGEDNLQRYAPQVMRPKFASFESVESTIQFADGDEERIKSSIVSLVEGSNSLTDLCDGYLNDLGRLPLRSPNSFADVVQRWMDTSQVDVCWSDLWDWSDGTNSPISKYHVLTFFAANPGLVEEAEWGIFWDEVIKSLSAFTDGTGMGQSDDSWRLWQQLAKLYYLIIETQIPDSVGVNVAAGGWWLASHVGSVLGSEEGSIPSYLKEWIAPEMTVAGRSWSNALPPVQSRDLFSYLTYVGFSPWGYALISQMSKTFDDLNVESLSSEQLTTLSNALVFSTAFTAPIAQQQQSVLALDEEGFYRFVENFSHWPADEVKMLKEIVSFTDHVATLDNHIELLKLLPSEQRNDVAFIAMATRKRCYLDREAHEELWKLFNSEGWLRGLIDAHDLQHLDVFFEAMLSLIFNEEGEWYHLLPHFLARACDETDDKEKRVVLFDFVIKACVGSNTVSSLQFLFNNGSHKYEYREMAKNARHHIVDSWPMLPGWVQAKMRAILTILP